MSVTPLRPIRFSAPELLQPPSTGRHVALAAPGDVAPRHSTEPARDGDQRTFASGGWRMGKWSDVLLS